MKLGAIYEQVISEDPQSSYTKLIHSDEFKAWFGDWENNPSMASKVVDENGLPLIVYRTQREEHKHGNFEWQMGQKHVFGIYFSQDKESTSIYGNTTREYLIRLMNPKILRGIEHDEMWNLSIITKDKHQHLIDGGHDGAIWLRDGIMYEIVVFDKNQISLLEAYYPSK